MSFGTPDTPALPVPPAAAQAPPMFGSQPQGKKPKAKSQTPTFLGSEAVANPSNTGQKTLLGT